MALVEITGQWPGFLSALKDDPTTSEEFKMENEIIVFDSHFHGFTQLYQPDSDSPTAEYVHYSLGFISFHIPSN